MENREILVAYLSVWLPYVIGLHAFARWRRISQYTVMLSHVIPSVVAVVMASIFLLGHGATVRQLVAGNERGMDLWSLWFCLWPALLLATFGAGFGQMAGLIVAFKKRRWRDGVPITLTAAAMCLFSFLVVMANFLDA